MFKRESTVSIAILHLYATLSCACMFSPFQDVQNELYIIFSIIDQPDFSVCI